MEASLNITSDDDGGRVRFHYQGIAIEQLDLSGNSEGSDILVSTVEEGTLHTGVDDYDRFVALESIPMELEVVLTEKLAFSGFRFQNVKLNAGLDVKKGTFQNCVFLSTSTDIRYTTLLNCVVFDTSSATAAVETSTVTAYNTIFETSPTVVPDMGTEGNLKSASINLFQNAGTGNFHLHTTNGSAAFGGGTSSKPTGWVGSWTDIDGVSRAHGSATDIGIDEIVPGDSTDTKTATIGSGNDANGGSDPTGLIDIPRFYYKGTRGSIKAGYLITGQGSADQNDDCRLHVVDVTNMQSLKSIRLPGVPLWMTYRTNSTSSYGVWILVILDTGNNTTKTVGTPDGKGDALCVVYDNGTTLSIPSGTVASATLPQARKFGNESVTFPTTGVTATVLRPAPGSGYWYQIQKVAIHHYENDGDSTANPSSGYGTNHWIRWNRMWFVGSRLESSVEKGSLFKVNFDAYDYANGTSQDNGTWGEVMWSLTSADNGWYNFSPSADISLTWGSTAQTLAVAVNQDSQSADDEVCLIEFSKFGYDLASQAPTDAKAFHAEEDAVDSDDVQNRFGSRTVYSEGKFNYTYQNANGSVLYQNETDSSSDTHLATTPLGDDQVAIYGAGSTSTYVVTNPVVPAKRLWPNKFFLTAVKVPEATISSTTYPKKFLIRKIWAEGTYRACRVSDGVRLAEDDNGVVAMDDLDTVTGAADTNSVWPIEVDSMPIDILTWKGVIYYATKDCMIYAKTWNGSGHGGEGTNGNGYPYNISPDVPKTISVVPGIGILIGTTDGEFILKGFGN